MACRPGPSGEHQRPVLMEWALIETMMARAKRSPGRPVEGVVCVLSGRSLLSGGGAFAGGGTENDHFVQTAFLELERSETRR